VQALLALDATRKRMLMVLSGAGAYLTVAPRFAHLRLKNVEARAAALIRLGLPHACMEAVGGADKLGRHAMRKKGAGRNAVHGTQTQCMAGLSRRAGRTATVEVVGLYGPYPGQLSSAPKKGENRRMDLVEQNVAACTLDLVDNTICDGATPSLVSGAAALENPLHALATAEKDEAAKYDADKPACSTYITFAQGTQCELGVQAVKWLQKWALDVAQLEGGGVAPAK
jgi:hypothetical protein